MPRGGRRSGQRGKLYPNRSDMHVPKAVVPGQGYGEAKKQMEAQDAIPLGSPPVAVAGSPPSPTAAGGLPPPFNRPTDRPGEPITAGLSVGPGAGPESLRAASQLDDASIQLRALYAKFPVEELREIIEALDAGD